MQQLLSLLAWAITLISCHFELINLITNPPNNIITRTKRPGSTTINIIITNIIKQEEEES